jgi:hypothetical protein
MPAYLINRVIPENHSIALQLANDLGTRFESNGVFPQLSTLRDSDLDKQFQRFLSANAAGELANRWGQPIQVAPILLEGTGNPLYLELTVTSPGIWGCLGSSSVSIMCEYDYIGLNEEPWSAPQNLFHRL